MQIIERISYVVETFVKALNNKKKFNYINRKMSAIGTRF
jgi:hypothetical protein